MARQPAARTVALPHHLPGRLARRVRVVRARTGWLAVLGWITINALAVLIARGHLPFDRPVMEGVSFTEQLVSANVAMVEALALIALVVWLTRHRHVPGIVARLPTATDARHETLIVLSYGVLALFGGVALGQALGMDAISFHLAGTLFGRHTHDLATPAAVFIWAGYNLVVYAVVPFVVFRRRSSASAMLLTSGDRRKDLQLVATVLIVESTMQFLAVSTALFDLAPRQVLLGAPLTFGLYFVGTVLPTMIFLQAILVPRYLAITGSVPTTVVLGGLTYAALHFPEAWMVLTSPGNAVLSLIFLLLTYFGPGMVKTVLTLRTGNAWVHVWAYHAFAPHTLIDTPLIVRIFGIR
jgi:hypothetical protein